MGSWLTRALCEKINSEPSPLRSRLATLPVLLMTAMAGYAAETCPWLNAATARGVLGGDVTIRVAHPKDNQDDAGCAFELKRSEFASKLTIEVDTMHAPQTDFASYMARCTSQRVPLRAIGNEAVACGGTDPAGRWELVVSRVRNHAFVVRISTSDLTQPSELLRERARKTAEQVAGFLF